jgi:ABC-type lipoprotein export system ATPase subunit/CRP-like cAMP-binding protein
MSSESNSSGNDSFIKIKNLVKTYKTPAGDFTALKNLNVEVGRGEFVAVIGKSGSGKSTFINMITGIDRPTSGEVWAGGTPLHNLNETQMAAWRGKNLGIVFQFFQLLPTLTLVENVILAMELNNQYSRRQRREQAMYLLEQVEMAAQANKLPSAVSGGQQQRVAIARALANNPQLIVADEPTGSLDSKTADKIFILFEKLVEQGKTILVVTHDNDQVKRATRKIVISDGEIVNEYLVQALASLSHDQLVEVRRRSTPKTYPPNAYIIRQGEVGTKLYMITEGSVDVLLDQRGGSQITVNKLHEGQYFGEMALLGDGLRTASVKASGETGVSVVALDGEGFTEIINQSTALRQELSQIIDKRQIMQRVQTLSALDRPTLLDMTKNLTVQTILPGADIVTQGDIGDSFFVLIEGNVDVLITLENGTEKKINELEEGQCFGEIALMGNKRRSATVRASISHGVQPAKVVELTATAFDRLMYSSPRFGQLVYELNQTRRTDQKDDSGASA